MAKGHFLLGFILGGASALAATYLLTPQTSDELKHKWQEKRDDLADRAADYYDYAKDATADWRESAADFVSDLKDRAHTTDTGDLADYDDATAALKDELTAAPEVAENDDFDDIVVDGKSAFAQAKESADADAADADVADVAEAPEAPIAERAADDEAAGAPDDGQA